MMDMNRRASVPEADAWVAQTASRLTTSLPNELLEAAKKVYPSKDRALELNNVCQFIEATAMDIALRKAPELDLAIGPQDLQRIGHRVATVFREELSRVQPAHGTSDRTEKRRYAVLADAHRLELKSSPEASEFRKLVDLIAHSGGPGLVGAEQQVVDMLVRARLEKKLLEHADFKAVGVVDLEMF